MPISAMKPIIAVNEIEWAGEPERGDAADYAERDHRRDDARALEGAELEHQHGEYAEGRDEQRGAEAAEALLAALELAATSQCVPGSQSSAASGVITSRVTVSVLYPVATCADDRR